MTTSLSQQPKYLGTTRSPTRFGNCRDHQALSRLTNMPHEPCCPRNSTSQSRVSTLPWNRHAHAPLEPARRCRSSHSPGFAGAHLVPSVSAIAPSVAIDDAAGPFLPQKRRQRPLAAESNASVQRPCMAWTDRHAAHPPGICRPWAPAPLHPQRSIPAALPEASLSRAAVLFVFTDYKVPDP